MVIDVNVSFGFWPFQKFREDSPAKLAHLLKSEGVTKALVSSIEAVLFPDPHVCNKSIIKKLKPYPSLVPVMVVNPRLTNWKDSLALSGTTSAVKVFPNYHNYSLSSRHMAALMKELAARDMALLLQMRLEDERNQYPLMKVAGVRPEDVVKLAKRFPKVKMACLCPYMYEAVELVKKTDNVYIDISFSETLNTVSSLLENVPARRVLFGSHTPFLYARSAIMKLQSAAISKKELNAIAFMNARKYFYGDCHPPRV